MDFKPLPINEVRTFAKQLSDYYIGSSRLLSIFTKEKPERKQFLKLFATVTEQLKSNRNEKEVSQIIYGTLLYGLRSIKEFEYKKGSPQKNALKGSRMYTKIKELMGIRSENLLKDAQRLIYLNKFYWYVKRKFPEQKELHQNVIKLLKSLKMREDKRIGIFAQSTTSLSTLRQNVLGLSEEYAAMAKARGYHNTRNENLLNTVHFVFECCDARFNPHYSVDKKGEPSYDFDYLKSCNIHMGVMVYMLLKITEKYKLLSPSGTFLLNEGSELYKQCVKALGVSKFSDLDPKKKLEWLQALSVEIKALKNQHAMDTKTFNQLVEKYHVNLEKLDESLDTVIKNEYELQASPSLVSSLTNNSIQYSLGFAATHCASDVVLSAVSGAVTSVIGGPVVLVMYLTGGTILMTQLGRLVKDHVIPPASLWIYTWVLETLGTHITNTTETVTTRAFEATKQGINDLINSGKLKSEEIEILNDYKEALLTLPSEVMSEEEKNQIRSMFVTQQEISTFTPQYRR